MCDGDNDNEMMRCDCVAMLMQDRMAQRSEWSIDVYVVSSKPNCPHSAIIYAASYALGLS
jgi:hypothetical protein